MDCKLYLSGFADEINENFDTQLQCLEDIGMRYLCFRAGDGKPIAEYSVDDFKASILSRMRDRGMEISSLGTPIGKIDIDDEQAFAEQKELLKKFCKMAVEAGTKYLRIFSFFMPENGDPDSYSKEVISKLREFISIAEPFGLVLIHENEKGIFGDSPERCALLHNTLDCATFKCAFDFANFVQCDYDPELAFSLLKSYVVYIHIKDALFSDHSNVLCGTGDGKIKELLRKFIEDEQYEGFLTLEPHLVEFSTLKTLEREGEEEVEREADVNGEGVRAFKSQATALKNILAELGYSLS